MDWQVLLESDPTTGGWAATCPALPGVAATATTRSEALSNIRSAIASRRSSQTEYHVASGRTIECDLAVYERNDQLSLAFETLDLLGIEQGRRRGNHLAFGWYGGKFSHLAWLLPLLPDTNHYCEPFAGSAAVLLNRKPAPVETYNDLDGEVVNFFTVLRQYPEKLVEAIALTPFSREELARACDGKSSTLDPVERARRFYVRARQTRTGLAQTASPGRWATCRNTSRRGMGGAVSRWLGSAPDLIAIAARLLRVQFDNRPAADVIRAYDTPDTLFYCDPPYPHESRGDSKAYAFEMSDEEHEDLARVLHSALGKVAISGYRCPLMDRLYGGWKRLDAPSKPCHSTKDLRQETLWVNYSVSSELLNGASPQ